MICRLQDLRRVVISAGESREQLRARVSRKHWQAMAPSESLCTNLCAWSFHEPNPCKSVPICLLQDLRRVAMEELKKVESNLDKESSEDAELRDKYGSRWNRPASAALNSSMREKIAGYNANLTAAGDSDTRLEQRLMQNNAAFSALSIDAAVAQMPRLQVGLDRFD